MSILLILNGPNLNLLGAREPHLYGTQSLNDINAHLETLTNHTLLFFQSNAEHQLINRLQQAHLEHVDFIIFNPASFTHTSIALRDTLLAIKIPFIEVHLSNIKARESFRQLSYFSDIARGVIMGFGPIGYQLALIAAEQQLTPTKE